MSTTRTRSDFINFIIDSGEKAYLADEFMKKRTPKELHSFFQKNGYKDIPANDCKDILEARGDMLGRHIPKKGQTAKGACVPGGKAY